MIFFVFCFVAFVTLVAPGIKVQGEEISVINSILYSVYADHALSLFFLVFLISQIAPLSTVSASSSGNAAADSRGGTYILVAIIVACFVKVTAAYFQIWSTQVTLTDAIRVFFFILVWYIDSGPIEKVKNKIQELSNQYRAENSQ